MIETSGIITNLQPVVLAQVNFGGGWSSFLGIALVVAGAGLYSLRAFRPKLARDYDIFFAAVGLLCGGILFFQGWRQDPILQFGQFLLTGSTIFFAVESIRLRGIVTQQAKQNATSSYVDDDRPVSSAYRYQEEYEAELEELEPVREYPPSRRIPGTPERRRSTRDTREDPTGRSTRRPPTRRPPPSSRTRPARPGYDAWEGEDPDVTPRPPRPANGRPTRTPRRRPPTTPRSRPDIEPPVTDADFTEDIPTRRPPRRRPNDAPPRREPTTTTDYEEFEDTTPEPPIAPSVEDENAPSPEPNWDEEVDMDEPEPTNWDEEDDEEGSNWDDEEEFDRPQRSDY